MCYAVKMLIWGISKDGYGMWPFNISRRLITQYLDELFRNMYAVFMDRFNPDQINIG